MVAGQSVRVKQGVEWRGPYGLRGTLVAGKGFFIWSSPWQVGSHTMFVRAERSGSSHEGVTRRAALFIVYRVLASLLIGIAILLLTWTCADRGPAWVPDPAALRSWPGIRGSYCPWLLDRLLAPSSE